MPIGPAWAPTHCDTICNQTAPMNRHLRRADHVGILYTGRCSTLLRYRHTCHDCKPRKLSKSVENTSLSYIPCKSYRLP